MKHMLITGVSRGIGAGLARHYLNAGWEVFGSVRRAEDGEELRLEFPERFKPLIFDVRDSAAVSRAAQELRRTADGLELIINSAGIAPDEPGNGVTDVDEEQLALAFDVNVLGPVRVVKAFFPLLKSGENPKLIMISSVVGSMARTGGGRGIPYCVSKAALNMMSLLLSFRLREEGIPIAAIHPGWVRTDMGGSAASLTVEESAASLAEVIEKLSMNSPLYLDYRGEEIPW